MSISSAALTYEVFLCHNSKEKAAVRAINEVLRQQYGLRTYLDESELIGGQAWERAIEAALAAARACAVIVGPHGWGRYQLEREVRPAVRRRGEDPSFRVIPVLLPGVDIDALVDFRDFFSQTHWVTFRESSDEPDAIRSLSFALRGENAFPEGPPRLTLYRIRFDAIRWDSGSRRDNSLLYAGAVLHDALDLAGEHPPAPVPDFLATSLACHNERLARQLGAHAHMMWNNPRRRDLAARLALESVRRCTTVEGLTVLRQADADLHSTIGSLTHPAAVAAAVNDADRTRLATGCVDGSVCVWDGSKLQLVGRHAAAVRSVVDLANGHFAIGAADGTITLWRWNGERVGQLAAGPTLAKLEARRTAAAETMLLASGGRPGQPGQVVVWNVDAQAELWRMPAVADAALSADGERVALAWGDHVVLRATRDGELAAKGPVDAPVVAVATHPTQPWVAAVDFDRRASMLLFSDDSAERRELGSGASRVSPIRISPNGRYVAALQDDFRVVVWDISDGTKRLFKYEGLMAIDIRFSDESRYLAVISPEANTVAVWRLDDGRAVCTIEQDAPQVAVFDDRRNALWIASHGVAASLIQLPRQTDALSVATPGVAMALAFGPHGLLAWSGSPVGEDLTVARDIGLWVANPLTGQTRVDAKLSEPCRLAFDLDGQHVAAVGNDAVRVWHLATGEETPAPEIAFWVDRDAADRDRATAALLATPVIADACAKSGKDGALLGTDGRSLAIHHGNQLLSLWSASAPPILVARFSTAGELTQWAFSRDGQLFASGDMRGVVMLWQTDGTALGQVQHDEPISYLAFSPDGRYLAVASVDSALRIWIVSPRLLAESVTAKASGPLTQEEWSRYLGDEPRSAPHRPDPVASRSAI